MVRASSVDGGSVNGNSTGLVPVEFRVHKQVPFGEHLVITGSSAFMGSWDIVQAPEMAWSEGDLWSASIFVEAGASLEYKYVRVRDGRAVEWQAGPNMDLQVPQEAPGLVVKDPWAPGSKRQVTLSEGVAAQQQQQQQHPDDLAAAPAHLADVVGRAAEEARSLNDILEEAIEKQTFRKLEKESQLQMLQKEPEEEEEAASVAAALGEASDDAAALGMPADNNEPQAAPEASSASSYEATMDDLMKSYKVVELKEMLKERDLPVRGRKADLAGRLARAMLGMETSNGTEQGGESMNAQGTVVDSNPDSEVAIYPAMDTADLMFPGSATSGANGGSPTGTWVNGRWQPSDPDRAREAPEGSLS